MVGMSENKRKNSVEKDRRKEWELFRKKASKKDSRIQEYSWNVYATIMEILFAFLYEDK